MEDILDLPPETSKTLRPAGFLRRLLALVIDAVILTLGLYFALSIFLFSLSTTEIAVIFSIMIIVYSVSMETASVQGTVGKILVKLKVADREGKRLSAGAGLMRLLWKVVSGATLGMGALMMIGDEQRKTLHDLMSNTIVHEV